MACFYCAQEGVHSSDNGPCCESCGKDVCTAGVTANDEGPCGDQCNCGCAGLVCRYEMNAHSQSAHNSTVDVCFPNTSFEASLGAGAAIEESGDIDIAASSPERTRIGRAVRRLYTLAAPPAGDVPLPFSGAPSANDFDFNLLSREDDWPRIAAMFVPYILITIPRTWMRFHNRQFELRISGDTRAKIEQLSKAGFRSWDRVNNDPSGALAAWSEFSPRLTALMLEFGQTRSRERFGARDWLASEILAKANIFLLRSLVPQYNPTGMSWRQFPRTLSLRQAAGAASHSGWRYS